MATSGPLFMHVRWRLRWWVEWYLHGLIFFCHVFGTVPDFDKVWAMILRGFIVEVRRGNRWKRIA